MSRSDSRRFRAYNVGIAKTATTSVANLFRDCYRSGHEYWFEPCVRLLDAHGWGHDRRGGTADEEIESFLRKRDEAGKLEMDSASFNHHFLPYLVELYPDAKFLCTVRDCYTWINSAITMALRHVVFEDVPDWLPKYGEAIFDMKPGQLVTNDHQRFQTQVPRLIYGGISYWARSNRAVVALLDELPDDQCLIVRTSELGDSLSAIADLVGVPPDTLDASGGHSNEAPKKVDWLGEENWKHVEAVVRDEAGDLMDRFFPDLDPREAIASYA